MGGWEAPADGLAVGRHRRNPFDRHAVLEGPMNEDISGSPRGQDAESHFVTVVKCDVVDSTRVWRRLSRADGLELLRGFKAAVLAVVPAGEVTIEWEGDGALVAFGYPRVRVDAAEAAVRAGLRLIDAVGAVKAVPGVHLQLRVGIASGVMTVDLTTGGLDSMAIKKAERLKTVAAPGQVVIDADTRHFVNRFFDYEDLGVVSLKGFDEGARAWRVVGETSVVSRFLAQRLDDASGEIIGRASALARLADAWAAAREGRGTAVCLVGEPGMGKSRLARAALEQAARDGALVVEVDCTPSSGNSPLLPIGVLLRRTAHITAGASEGDKAEAARALLTRLLGEREAVESLPYLAPLFGIENAPLPLHKTRDQVRAATIAAIVAIFRALAGQRPLAVLCEDLQWADDTTAQVGFMLAQIVGELRALLIVTRWPTPVTPIDLDAVTAAFDTIRVEPLPAPTAADLVRAVAGTRLPPARIDAIVRRCGGVPLLLEEVTRSILEASDAEAAVPADTDADSRVPPELQLIVESRLDRRPELKGIIEAAAVLGPDFPVALLESMVPDRRAHVPAAIAAFADQGLFAQPDPAAQDRAGFRHGLIRDAVYETLVSRDYLRRLHSRAADALLSAYEGTPDASPDVLALHLRVAERVQEAIRIRLAAGEDTFSRGAYVEAKGHCEAVRALIDAVPDQSAVRQDAFTVCVLLGMVGSGLHGYSAEPAERAYREAQAMFDADTTAERRYPVNRGLATAALVRGDLATAHGYSLEGLTLADQSNRPDYRIDAMSVHSYTTLYFGRLDECRTWIERCLALYDAEGGEQFRYPVPQDAKSAALALLPTAAWLQGDPAAAEAAVADGLAHVERLGRDFDRALLHAWTAGTRYTQRRYLEALQHGNTAYALGRQHRFQEWEGVGAMMTLLAQSALQPAPEAVAQAIAVSREFQAKGVGLNASYFLWGIARGFLTAGNPDSARAVLGTALDVAAASRETRMHPEIWMLQAELEPDDRAALGLLARAFDLAESHGAVANALRAGALLVVRAGSARHGDQARETLECLDGRGTAAAAGWMRQALDAIRSAVAEARVHPPAS
jgi:class 3 adenylate cyclase